MSAMKMAVASKEDLNKLRLFYQVIEAYHRDSCVTKDQFDHFSDEELDQLKTIWKSNGEIDWEQFIALGWNYLLTGFFRVHFGYEVLYDNCCDPSFDHLEFKPWISKSIEVLSEIDEYLSPNPKNAICTDSVLHQKVKEVLALHEGKEVVS